MIIPPASLLFLLAFPFVILTNGNRVNRLIFFCLVIEVFFRMGKLIIINESSNITIELFVQYVLIFFCSFHLMKANNIVRKRFILLIGSYIIPIFLLEFFPSSEWVGTPDVTWDDILNGAPLVHPVVTSRVIRVTMKMGLFALVYVYIYTYWKRKDYEDLLYRLSKLSNIFLFLGVIEFAAKNFLGLNDLWGDVLMAFFGKAESTAFSGRLRGNLYELNLFTLEASHYAYVLMYICLIKMASNIVRGRKAVSDPAIWLAIALMTLSTSFSAVYLIPSFFFLYIIYRWYIVRPKSRKIEMMTLGGLAFIALSSLTVFLSMNVDSVIFERVVILFEHFDEIFSVEWTHGDTTGDGSTKVRMVSMVQTFLAFLKRPIFGYSLSALDAHSAMAYFLSSVGFFGLYCWIKFYFKTIPLREMCTPNIILYRICFIWLFLVHLVGGEKRVIFGLMLLGFLICFCTIFSKTKHKSISRVDAPQ